MTDEAATIETQEPTPSADAPEQTLDQSLSEGLDKVLSGEEPAVEAPEADEPAAEVEQPVTGEPAPTDPAAKPPGDAEAEAAKRDEATETEVASLGLKDKSAERFRSMANEIKELAPIRDALEKAGIKDVAQLPQITQHANDYRELIGMVQDTGATPEQYGTALNYLKVVNAANAGDVKAAEAAFAMMSEELTTLAKMLGKEVPGIVDPLVDYPDLAKQVSDGDMTRAAALEVVQARNARAMGDARHQRTEQQTQQQQAIQQGVQSLDALGNELAASDPHYATKAPILIAQLRAIQEVLPPSLWAQKARAMYQAIPNPAPVAAAPAAPTPARVVPGAVRNTSHRPAVIPVTDDPFEALEQGLAAASGL